MRLLNTKTFELQYHVVPPPNYAILSHTWREGELVFEEYSQDECRKYLNGDSSENARRRCYKKIRYLCDQATEHDIPLAWIDTICIDKSSSAELSEAINSMFQWYSEAAVCYVYLDDVDVLEELEKSRWLTRGWTLQELIAPLSVEFYSKTWKPLGSKATLATKLSRYTHIDVDLLRDRTELAKYRVATKFSWAAYRTTTRAEDEAYCLFGLFGVTMPLLYGEGKQAFQRLQKEILRICPDESILAWTVDQHYPDFFRFSRACLAPGAYVFRNMHNKNWPSTLNRKITLTESGHIQLDAKILVRGPPKPTQFFSLLCGRLPRVRYYVVLMCQDPDEQTAVATAFRIEPCKNPQLMSSNVFKFMRTVPEFSINAAELSSARHESIGLQISGVQVEFPHAATGSLSGNTTCTIHTKSPRICDYSVRVLGNSNRKASTYVGEDSITSRAGRCGTYPFQTLAFLHSSKKEAFAIDFRRCSPSTRVCVMPYFPPLHEDDLEVWLDTFDCAREQVEHSSGEPRPKEERLDMTLQLPQSSDGTRDEVHHSHVSLTSTHQLTLRLPRSLRSLTLKLRKHDQRFFEWSLDVRVGPAEFEDLADDWAVVSNM